MYHLFSQIIETPFLTIPFEVTEKRTLKDRFLSWPWKPWVKTKVVTYQKPDPHFYQVGTRIFCHPATAEQLKKIIPPAPKANVSRSTK